MHIMPNLFALILFMMRSLVLSAPEEMALSKSLIRFEDVLMEVLAHHAPHKLCDYIFDLTSVFNVFYDKCPVLKVEEGEEVRMSRLALCKVTAGILSI